MADRDLTRSALAVNREPEQRTAEGITVLARDDSFEGAMRVKGDATILGTYEGDIECGSELMIGREAEVVANIRTLNLTISGRVQGNIVVSGRLRITATGRLEGDAKAGALVVQEGGVHLGSIKVFPEGVPTEDQRSAPLVQRTGPPPPQPPAPPAHSHPGPAQQVQHTAEARATNGAAHAQGRPVERVKKLWGEFF